MKYTWAPENAVYIVLYDNWFDWTFVSLELIYALYGNWKTSFVSIDMMCKMYKINDIK